MIFVTVGSSPTPFQRLVLAADGLARDGENVLIQYGRSLRPIHARGVDFLPLREFEKEIENARVVVGHAGVGTVALCLQHGKRPLLVPRLKSHRENVDDHQLAFAFRLHALGVADMLVDVGDLASAVTARTPRRCREPQPSAALERELLDAIETAVRL